MKLSPPAFWLPLGLVAAWFLGGCATSSNPSLEILDPVRASGVKLAVADDFHRDNAAIEQRLAADLRTALTRRGWTVVDDPAQADLVVLPTLGRMRQAGATPAERSTRTITPQSGVLDGRRQAPSARPVAGGQTLGLLLTAVPAEQYTKYGLQHQVLEPVWRVYVSRPAGQLDWNNHARPLIESAARAAGSFVAATGGD